MLKIIEFQYALTKRKKESKILFKYIHRKNGVFITKEE